jgi:hypothetical protein
MDVTGAALDANKVTNPANLDGDHVLIGFLNDSLSEPIILKGLPHPITDTGQEDGGAAEAGHRLLLKVADGNPDFWKHRGAFYGVSDDGDFVVDLTRAYATDLDSEGKQPTPPADGTTGNYKVKIPTASKLTVEIAGGDNLELDLKDGNAKLTLGDGAVSVAVADHLATLYNGLKSKLDTFDGHTHGAGTLQDSVPAACSGSTAGPSVTVGAAVWDSDIESDKLTIPDTTPP